MLKTGELFETRRKQQRVWMWNHITQHIMQVVNSYYVIVQPRSFDGLLIEGFPGRSTSHVPLVRHRETS